VRLAPAGVIVSVYDALGTLPHFNLAALVDAASGQS
jgi:hypothetical protein